MEQELPSPNPPAFPRLPIDPTTNLRGLFLTILPFLTYIDESGSTKIRSQSLPLWRPERRISDLDNWYIETSKTPLHQKEVRIARKTDAVKTAVVSSTANKHSHQHVLQILADKSDRFQETTTTKPDLDKPRGWKFQTSSMILTGKPPQRSSLRMPLID
jgi:hypothetical protein